MPRKKNVSPGVYPYETEAGKRWGAVYYASPDQETGQPRQRRKQGFATKAEALAWRVANLNARNRGADTIEPSKQPLSDYLDDWLDSLVDVAPGTRRNYRNRLVGIKRELGNVIVSQLTPAAIERCHANRLRNGESKTEVRFGHRVLKQALRKAHGHGLIANNPADMVKPPRETKHEPTAWSLEQMQRFIAVNGEDPTWGLLWILIAETWLRISEASDLRWSDIDVDTSTMTISHAISRDESLTWVSGVTKTESSRRTILLSSALTNLLRARHAIVDDPSPNALIFPAPRSGGFLKSQSVAHALERACIRAGVPIIGPHELRHNGGSLAYMNGIDILTISERMGHSNIRTTMTLYVHLNEAHHRSAAGMIAGLLGIEYDSDITDR